MDPEPQANVASLKLYLILLNCTPQTYSTPKYKCYTCDTTASQRLGI